MPFSWRRAHLTLVFPLLALACGDEDPRNPGGAGGTGATAPTTSSTGGSGGAGGGPGNRIISSSPETLRESEGSVAATPGGVVVAAWMAYTSVKTTLGYAFSPNGGATFGPVALLEGPDGRNVAKSTLAVDAAGNFYVSFLAFAIAADSTPIHMGVFVAKAPAGETAFGAPVLVSDPAATDAELPFTPWITITSAGTLVVTYTVISDQSLNVDVVAAWSADGVTWQRSLMASGDTRRDRPQPCAARGGSRLYAAWRASDVTSRVELVHSDDEGATWSAPVVVNEASAIPTNDNPSCVAAGNDVWVSYASDLVKSGQPIDTHPGTAVYVVHSGDGATFDDRLAAHDPAAGPLYLHPQLAREDGGALDLVYYAGASDPDAAGTYRRARRPATGGAFGASVPLESPLTFLGALDDERWLGGYPGVAWSAGRLYTAYATNRSGPTHVAFAALAP
jgi:hypothetical protein